MAKTIVFCVDSEHAEQMRMALNNANTDLARQHPDHVVRMWPLEGDVGMEHLGNFADPESATPVIATTSKLLSTGVDRSGSASSGSAAPGKVAVDSSRAAVPEVR